MIEIKNIQKSFNEKPVLRNVNLTINSAENLVIIGRSGCGKSVLLKHILGLIEPDSGEIFIDGESILQMSEKHFSNVRKRFGMLFQGAALFDSMTVGENIALALSQHKELNISNLDKRIKETLKLVGLPGIEDKKPAELSGGMQKRVGLARAISTDPQYILYDEPTTGLDPIMADIIDNLILKIKESTNATSIVVTHDMKSAYKVADRIVMLHRGNIFFDGTPDTIRKTTNPTVRQFIEGNAEGPIKAV